MGNNIRNTLNQASSDSELTSEFINRAAAAAAHGPLSDSSDLHLKKSDKDLQSLISSSKYIYLSPMQNMKHNVTEKVAQVSSIFKSFKPLSYQFSFLLNILSPKANAVIHDPCNSRQVIGLQAIKMIIGFTI